MIKASTLWPSSRPPPGVRWALIATNLLVAAHISCSGPTVEPPSDAPDARLDAMTDADASQPRAEAAVDSRDTGPIPCTPGDEPIVCPAIITGCPSLSYCSERFGLTCPCRSCTFALEPDVCFWTVITDYPDASWVDRITGDGGSQRVPRVTDRPCGDHEYGFFVTSVPGTTTVTLCPASCTEHHDDPTIVFRLDRGPCPPP